MSDWECPHCNCEYDGTGHELIDVGVKECGECGREFIVTIEYTPEYYTEAIPYVSPEDQKRNDAMERGDELRDRAKDEKQ